MNVLLLMALQICCFHIARHSITAVAVESFGHASFTLEMAGMVSGGSPGAIFAHPSPNGCSDVSPYAPGGKYLPGDIAWHPPKLLTVS